LRSPSSTNLWFPSLSKQNSFGRLGASPMDYIGGSSWGRGCRCQRSCGRRCRSVGPLNHSAEHVLKRYDKYELHISWTTQSFSCTCDMTNMNCICLGPRNHSVAHVLRRYDTHEVHICWTTQSFSCTHLCRGSFRHKGRVVQRRL
jgi:hypothetical protein